MQGLRLWVLCWVLCVPLVMGSLFVVQAQDATQGATQDVWVGVYRLEGTNPDGKTYTGAVEITRIKGALYQLAWRVDGGDEYAFGFEHGGVLHATGISGPLNFALTRDLDARWARPTADFATLGTEKLTRTRFNSLDEAGPGQRAGRTRRHAANERGI